MQKDKDVPTQLFGARLLVEEGQIDEAMDVLTKISTEDKQQQDEIAYLLGWCYIQNRCWDDAARVLSPLSMYSYNEDNQTDHIDRERSALCHLHLGYAAVNRSHYEDASRHFTKCLRLVQDKRVHLRGVRLKARYALGMTYNMRGLFAPAIQHYEEARHIFSDQDDEVELAHIYHGMCDTYRRWGKLIDALLVGKEALQLYQKLAHHEMEALMHNQLGRIYLRLADYRQASDHYIEAITIASSNNWYKILMINCVALADVRLAEERLDEAKRYCQRAQEIADRYNDRFLNGLTYLITGKVSFAEAQLTGGDKKQTLLEESVNWFEKANEQLATTHSYEDIAETYGRWAQALEELGQNREALQCWRAAFEASNVVKGLDWN